MSGFGKGGKGTIIRESRTITLGALANATAIKATSNHSIEEDFRILKTEYYISVEGHTLAEIPILIGIGDNQLSVAEIAETMLSAPVNRNDNAQMEQTHRPAFVLEQVEDNAITTSNNDDPYQFTKGVNKKPWTYSNDDGWVWFAYNVSGATLTSGTIIHIYAIHYGVWVT